MADSGGDKIEVKTLKTTDLDPSALTKAIEDSTKTSAKPPKGVKADTKPTKKSATSSEDKEDSTRIIVKNRSTYMSNVSPGASATADGKAGPQLKPPSATAKVFEAPPSPEAKETEVEETAETKISATPTSDKTEAPAEAAPTPPAQVGENLSKQVKKLDSKPDDPTAQQALKVFDTTQYHLPIKPTAGQHYLNNTLAWSVLIIFLAGISAYLLHELEVIDLSQFGL